MDIPYRGGSGGVTIIVRKFMVPDDIELVYKWSAHNFGGRLWKEKPPIDEITHIFKSIEESDIAQAFIVEVESHSPLFEIDIRLAETDPTCAHFKAHPNDYVINLLFPPNQDKYMAELGLNTCIECFFMKATVNINRILAPVYKQDRFLHNLLVSTGFEALKINRNIGIDKIYALSKGAFMHRRLSDVN